MKNERKRFGGLAIAAGFLVLMASTFAMAGHDHDGQNDWRPGDLFTQPMIVFHSVTNASATIKAYLRSDSVGVYSVTSDGKFRIAPPNSTVPSLTPTTRDFFFGHCDDCSAIHVKENSNVYLIGQIGNGNTECLGVLPDVEYRQQLHNQALMIAERYRLFLSAVDIIVRNTVANIDQNTFEVVHAGRRRIDDQTNVMAASLQTRFADQGPLYEWMSSQTTYNDELAPMKQVDWSKAKNDFKLASNTDTGDMGDNSCAQFATDYLFLQKNTSLADFLTLAKRLSLYVPGDSHWPSLAKEITAHRFWPVAQALAEYDVAQQCEAFYTPAPDFIILKSVVEQIDSWQQSRRHSR